MRRGRSCLYRSEVLATDFDADRRVLPSIANALPWPFGFSWIASVVCFVIAMVLGFAARTEATDRAAAGMAVLADMLAGRIEADTAQRRRAERSGANSGSTMPA
jgi:hypothetical protein